ncbi:glycoside hydrolase family protein [Oceanicaulis alexandrii]|uniref:glycoside hydrolase family protein n=1 Tax=Oceanicaulis alexandrii TaxID=153233 RepID=UPI0035D03786
MTPRLKSTRAARDLIKAHEPFLAEAERRGKRWTVGYGHTASAKEGVTLKPEDAELLLIYDVMRAEQTIDANVGAEMAAPMRDALVSFALSVGLRAFKVSDVARLARAGRHRDAAAAIETWVRADQDGRLVVSDRLVTRRAAEKALYLSGLEDSAANIDAPSMAAEPEPASEAGADIAAETPAEAPAAEAALSQVVEDEAVPDEPDAAPVDDAQAEAGPEPEPEPEDAHDASSGLVELDIAFETPDDETAGDSRVEPQIVSPDPEAAAEQGEDASQDESDSESETGEPEMVEASDAEPSDPAALSEPAEEPEQTELAPESTEPPEATETSDAPEADEAQPDLDAVKQAQDASIAAVMARMAQQVSASIATAPASTEAEDPVKLGYSFLSTAHVDMALPSVTRDTSETAQPVAPQEDVRAKPSSLFSSTAVPMGPFHGALQVSSIKVTAIAPEALPQGSDAQDADADGDVDSVQIAAPLSDSDDAISVEVPADEDAAPEALTASHDAPNGAEVFSAPPHPALAPASAPGMSGDVEGPDHPDKDDEDPHHDLHEDGEELDPTVVAGTEAPAASETEPTQSKGGDVMFISSLAVGGAMVGLGGWDIAANMDAYMELGLSYSPLGPIVFGAGVLLSAASAWFIIGRRNDK